MGQALPGMVPVIFCSPWERQELSLSLPELPQTFNFLETQHDNVRWRRCVQTEPHLTPLSYCALSIAIGPDPHRISRSGLASSHKLQKAAVQGRGDGISIETAPRDTGIGYIARVFQGFAFSVHRLHL